MEKYFPLGLLLAFCGHSLVLGISVPSVIVIVSLLAFIFGKDYMEKHKKIQDMVEIVNKQSEVIQKLAIEVDSVRTSVVGIKMQTGMASKKFG